jgi:hypothetical protein
VDPEDLDEEGRAIFTPHLSWGFAFSKVRKALLLKAVATELVLKAGVAVSSSYIPVTRCDLSLLFVHISPYNLC